MRDEDLHILIDNPLLRSEVSVVTLTEAFLKRIARYQPVINAFLTLTPDLALADARLADEARVRGERLPLDGMPIAVKDNIDVAGVRTTVGSKFFENNVAVHDAEVVRRLRAAGAIILGKAALHEFVFGVTTNNPFYGPTRNPWDLERIPGGSSGGSGAALAADLCIGALGSDTGGSVRIPAALTGVSGLRPTFGAVSNRGAFPIGWSLDCVGPMARSVDDLSRMLEVMVAYDPNDPRSVRHPVVDLPKHTEPAASGLRIGIPRGSFFDESDPEIEGFVRATRYAFKQLGATIVDVSLPDVAVAWETCGVLIRTDAYALHRRRFEQHPELFGEDVRRKLAEGKQVTGAQYSATLQWTYEWRRTVDRVFENIDILLTPTTNALAPRIADSAGLFEQAITDSTGRQGPENAARYAALTQFTRPLSLPPFTAMSLPCGVSREGLPIGVQLAGRSCHEALLLRAGSAYQRVTDWHQRRPPLP